MAVGGAASMLGYRGVALFLSNYDNTEPLPVSALAKGLIVPHIIMLLGMGMIAGGIIIIGRELFLKKRIESYND